jgi:hypothetical protein
MHKSFFDLLQEAQHNPATPNVAATLSVHHADSTVLFGYGTLRYYGDIPNLPGPRLPFLPPSNQIGGIPIHRFPVEGFSSRQSQSFKTVSSREQSFIVRGTWGEPQSFIVAVAQSISLSVYVPPKMPFTPYNPKAVVIAIESSALALSLQAEEVGNMLGAHGQGLDPTIGNALYVLSFDDVLFGDTILS